MSAPFSQPIVVAAKVYSDRGADIVMQVSVNPLYGESCYVRPRRSLERDHYGSLVTEVALVIVAIRKIVPKAS
jgi:hypothetical protein